MYLSSAIKLIFSKNNKDYPKESKYLSYNTNNIREGALKDVMSYRLRR